MNKPLKKDEIHLSEELLSKAFQLYASEAFESITKERMQAYLMWSSEEFEEKIPCMRSLYRQGIRGIQRDLLELAQFDPELEFEQGLQVIVRRFIVYVTKRPKLFEALLPPPIDTICPKSNKLWSTPGKKSPLELRTRWAYRKSFPWFV